MEYSGKYYQSIARYLFVSGLFISVVQAKLIHDNYNYQPEYLISSTFQEVMGIYRAWLIDKDVLSIPVKKVLVKPPSYLTKHEMEQLPAQLDTSSEYGRDDKGTGKGNKQRIVPIKKITAETLQRYIKDNGLLQNPDCILFTNSSGDALTRMGITYILKKYAKSAELPMITF